MYEDYQKLRETLENILDTEIDRDEIKKVLAETEDPGSPEMFYGYCYLHAEPHPIRLAAVQSLMDRFPGTPADTDKAEEILKTIEDYNWI